MFFSRCLAWWLWSLCMVLHICWNLALRMQKKTQTCENTWCNRQNSTNNSCKAELWTILFCALALGWSSHNSYVLHFATHLQLISPFKWDNCNRLYPFVSMVADHIPLPSWSHTVAKPCDQHWPSRHPAHPTPKLFLVFGIWSLESGIWMTALFFPNWLLHHNSN